LNLIEIELEHSLDRFDVIAAWHHRYNEDVLQKWVLSLL
jgi:hypothetical protein